MSQNRKIKAQVESTLKKIKEGLEEFETIWDKVYDATTQAQKEKNEEDLKKQIKKLQRYRDSLKLWTTSTDSTIVQFSNQIADAKKEIEDRMQKFRECEKETKTKAFSKEGLKLPNKQNPEDEKREEVVSSINKYLSELHKEIDDCEVEEKREKNKKRNVNKSLIAKLEGYLKNHRWHIAHLELVLRQIDNEILDPYDVEAVLDGVQEYLSSYRDKGYVFDDSLYEEFDLDVELSTDSSSDEAKPQDGEQEPVASKPPPKKAPVISPPISTAAQPAKPVSSPNKSVASPPINYACVVQRNSSRTAPSPEVSIQRTSSASVPIASPLVKSAPTAPTQPAAAPYSLSSSAPPTTHPTPVSQPIQMAAHPTATESTPAPPPAPSFIPPPLNPAEAPLWSTSEVMEMLTAAYTARTPCAHCDKLYYPSCPTAIPESFPQTPLREIVEGSGLRQMHDEELLFLFAYPVDENQHEAAARVLGEKDWRFCKEQKMWYREVEKDKYEVYDYTTWSVRQVQDIKNITLEKPPVLSWCCLLHFQFCHLIMSDLTIYSAFLDNSEDPATQSGPIFRHLLALDGLKTGLEGPERSMYDGFLRGSKLTETGHCLGYRPVENGNAGPYTWLSYKDVGEMVDKLSSEMMRKQLCEETSGCGLNVSDGNEARLVGIYAKTGYEWVVAEYACYRCNATVVTLYDSLGKDATRYILNLSRMETVFCGGSSEIRNLLELKQEYPEQVFVKSIISFSPADQVIQDAATASHISVYSLHDLISNCESILPAHHPAPDDICTICFTSGTTGNPKGVIVAHQTLLSLTLSINQHYRISFTPKDVVIAYLPLAHMFERFVEANALFNGACIGYWQGSTSSLMSDLQALRPTAFCAVPRIMQRIYGALQDKIRAMSGILRWMIENSIQAKEEGLKKNQCEHWFYDIVTHLIAKKVGLDRCRWILTGSAPIADEIVNFFKCVFSCAVLNGYGMTETAGGTCCSSSLDVQTVGHCGGPVCGIEGKLVSVPEKKYFVTDTVHYVNADDKIGIPICGRGELCFRGPGVFRGYFKNPEATAACMDADGWFHSGDIGFIRADNHAIQVIDRIKNIFKLSQGEYIAVEKVENVYLQNDLIDQICVYGDSTQNYIVAVVVPNQKKLIAFIEMSSVSDEVKQMDYAMMCEHADVRKLLLEELNKTALAANLFGFERVRNIHLEPTEWSVDNNVLSPSLKMKRHVTQEMYKEIIKEMYSEGQMI